jgi:hypothetical protein
VLYCGVSELRRVGELIPPLSAMPPPNNNTNDNNNKSKTISSIAPYYDLSQRQGCLGAAQNPTVTRQITVGKRIRTSKSE